MTDPLDYIEREMNAAIDLRREVERLRNELNHALAERDSYAGALDALSPVAKTQIDEAIATKRAEMESYHD